MNEARIILGDCLEVMRGMPDASVDSIVTDPPYGLAFMGKKWDYDVPTEAIWREALRVLKPGGQLLAFSGSRTYHRMVVRIEDAGFEIRDQLAWIYGSGFPKSHNLTGDYDGWGTALKPAMEPIVLARKPFAGTVAINVQAHGTGALNIDACRVEMFGETPTGSGSRDSWRELEGRSDRQRRTVGNITPQAGRWPANVIHDGSDEVLAHFPEAPGQFAAVTGDEPSDRTRNTYGSFKAERLTASPRGDSGSAARFFYCAKTSAEDRHQGLKQPGPQFKQGTTLRDVENATLTGNNHPTVKPTDLMRWLVRLITPPNGIVLDPFAGSGSTGKAAILEGFGFIGIEIDPAYHAIAEQRLKAAQPALLGAS